MSILDKLRVPPAPVMGAIVMACLAFSLIFIIIYRSPYTHSNLNAVGYNRTDIIYEGQTQPFTGTGVDNVSFANTGDPVEDGRVLFFAFNCASCHGLNGEGGPVGKKISDASANRISRQVRAGPKGMPAFDPDVFTDADMQKVIAFLQSLNQ